MSRNGMEQRFHSIVWTIYDGMEKIDSTRINQTTRKGRRNSMMNLRVLWWIQWMARPHYMTLIHVKYIEWTPLTEEENLWLNKIERIFKIFQKIEKLQNLTILYTDF